MILFGSTSLNSTAGRGTFHCPRCAMTREYQHIVVKRYFTLYFIPVIPLGSRGEYVECSQCTGTYGTEVLSYVPEERTAAPAPSWEDLRRCLIVLLLNAQRSDSTTLQQLKAWFERQTQKPVSNEVIAMEAKQAAEAGITIERFVQLSLSGIQEDGKLFALEAGRDLLKRDNRLDERDRWALRQLGKALGVPTQLIESTIAN